MLDQVEDLFECARRLRNDVSLVENTVRAAEQNFFVGNLGETDTIKVIYYKEEYSKCSIIRKISTGRGTKGRSNLECSNHNRAIDQFSYKCHTIYGDEKPGSKRGTSMLGYGEIHLTMLLCASLGRMAATWRIEFFFAPS